MDAVRGYRINPPTTQHWTYTCNRCGIQRNKSGKNPNQTYCLDCVPEAVALGWIPNPKEEAA